MEMPTPKIDNPHNVGASTRYIGAEDRLCTQMDTTTVIDILIPIPASLILSSMYIKKEIKMDTTKDNDILIGKPDTDIKRDGPWDWYSSLDTDGPSTRRFHKKVHCLFCARMEVEDSKLRRTSRWTQHGFIFWQEMGLGIGIHVSTQMAPAQED